MAFFRMHSLASKIKIQVPLLYLGGAVLFFIFIVFFYPKPVGATQSSPTAYEQIRPYVLRSGESANSVAYKFGLTVQELNKLNQFRTFSHGFMSIKAGDEIDVPTTPVQSPKRLTAGDIENETYHLAVIASQAGNFLSHDPSGDAAKSLALNTATARANQEVQNWLNKFGTTRVQLNIDNKFSLKDSSFKLLHPWYDTQDDLIFSQGAFHRTDSRKQANLGLGWRHFLEKEQMIGTNIFLDHDLSRSHTRVGFGAEYWRNYFKLGANAYLRVSNWKDAPDLKDYSERPANGWDLQAEGYLPSYPQLGAKLGYEQYYGDAVGLFGQNHRQKNPHTITVGFNYTPFSLLTVNAEHKRGQQSKNDTRLGFDINYHMGESLDKQLDSQSVSENRALKGSRYDFIERNNNIILEYRKQDVIHIVIPSRIQGYGKQTLPLDVIITKSVHGLKDIRWEAPTFFEAGGKISGHDDQWFITMPVFIPNGDNQYALAAIAYDNKGNSSQRVQAEIIVSAPTVSAINSTLTINGKTRAQMLANGADQQSIVFILRDASKQPVTGLASQIVLTQEFIPSGKSLVLSKGKSQPTVSQFQESSLGVYEAQILAGSHPGRDILTASIKGIKKSVELDLCTTLIDAKHSTLTVSPRMPIVANGSERFVLKLIARDVDNKPVTDASERLQFFTHGEQLFWSPVEEHQEGIYTTTLSSTHAQSLSISVHEGQSPLYQITATIEFIAGTLDISKSSLIQTPNILTVGGHATLSYTALDHYGNPLTNLTLDAITSGQIANETHLSNWNNMGNGVYTATITASFTPGNLSIMPIINGTPALQQPLHEIISTGVISIEQSTLTASPDMLEVGGTSTLTYTARSQNGNPVRGLQLSAMLTGRAATGSTISDWADNKDGTYTATLFAGKLAGILHIMPRINGLDGTTQATEVSLITGALDNTNSVLTISSNDLEVNSTALLTYIAQDIYGNPITNLTLNTVLKGSAAIDATISQWSNKGNGTYTAKLMTGSRSGELTIMPTFNGNNALHQPLNLYIHAGVISANYSHLVALSNNLTVGGTTTLSYTARDQNDNPIIGLQVVVELSGQTASGTTLSDWRDNGNGSYTATLFVGHVAGILYIMPRIAGMDGIAKATAVTVKAGALDLSHASMVLPTNSLTIGGQTNLTYSAQDLYGNPIKDLDLEITLAGVASVGTTVGKWTNNNNGTYSATLSVGMISGKLSLMPTINGNDALPKALQITITGDVAQADIRNIQVLRNNQLANSDETDKVVFVIQDNYHNALANQTVTLTLPLGMTTVQQMLTTDVQGYAWVELASVRPGAQEFTASLQDHKHKITINFAINVNSTELLLNGFTAGGHITQVPADNQTTIILQGTLTSGGKTGVPLDNQPIFFTVSPRSGLTLPALVKTNNKGEFKTTITSPNIGIWTVFANYALNSEKKTSSPLTIGFVPVSDHAQLSPQSVTAIPQLLPISRASTLTAKVDDGYGHVLKGQSVTFSVRYKDGSPVNAQNITLTPTQVLTNEQGIAIATLTSSSATDTNNPLIVTASIPQKNGNSYQGTVDIIFVADAQNGHATLMVENPGDKIANGISKYTLIADVHDNQGNKVTNTPVTFNLPKNVIPVAGESTLVKTDNHGKAELHVVSFKAGTYKVTATAGDSKSSEPQLLNFVANKSTAQISSLIIVNDHSIANGKAQETFIAVIKDANNNPIKDIDVTLRGTPNTLKISDNVKITDDNGQVAFSATSEFATTYILTASITRPEGQTVAQTIEAVFVADTAHAVMTITPDNVENLVANNNAVTNISLTLKAGKNPVNGSATVNIHTPLGVTANDYQIFPTKPITITNGKGYLSFRTKKAGIYKITITPQTEDGYHPTPLTIHVTAIADISTAQPATGYNVEVTPNSAIADSHAFITSLARVTDANDNPLKNATVNFRVHSQEETFPQDKSDPMLNPNKAQTDANGKASTTLTSKHAGIFILHASVNGKDTLANGEPWQSRVIFTADKRTATITQSGLILTTTTPVAGQSNTVTVKVTDLNGNPVVGEIVTLAIDNSPEEIRLSDRQLQITSPDGIATTTMVATKVGHYMLRATVNSHEQTLPFTVSADISNAELNLSDAQQGEGVADGRTPYSVIVSATDKYNNVLPNLTIRLNLPEGVRTITTYGDSPNEIRTDTQGMAIAKIISNVAGEKNITATPIYSLDGQLHEGLESQPLKITFEQILNITSLDTQEGIATDLEAGAQHTLIATIHDGMGKMVANKPIVFTVTRLDGSPINTAKDFVTLTPTNNGLTNVQGQAKATLSIGKIGKYRVKANLTSAVMGIHQQTLDYIVTIPEWSNPAHPATVIWSIMPVTAPILAGVPSILTAQVQDRFGNLFVNYKSGNKVKGKLALYQGDLITGIPVTETPDNNLVLNNSGKVQLAFTPQMGDYVAQINTSDNVIHSTYKLKAKANVNTGVLAAEIAINGQVADGLESDVVNLTLLDSIGNPLEGRVILKLSPDAPKGGMSISSELVVFNAGKAQVKLTATRPGLFQILFTPEVTGANKQPQPVSATLHFKHRQVARVEWCNVGNPINCKGQSVEKNKVGKMLTNIKLRALDKEDKPVEGVYFTLSRTLVVGRQNQTVTSGNILINGLPIGSWSRAKTNDLHTGIDGLTTKVITISDPQGSGAKSTIKATVSGESNEISASKDVIFTIITSPDSEYANMWGHMSETWTMDKYTVYRPTLFQECQMDAHGCSASAFSATNKMTINTANETYVRIVNNMVNPQISNSRVRALCPNWAINLNTVPDARPIRNAWKNAVQYGGWPKDADLSIVVNDVIQSINTVANSQYWVDWLHAFNSSASGVYCHP